MTSSMPFQPQIIEGTALTSRLSRQNRHNRRYLRQRCDKLLAAGQGPIRVGSARTLSLHPRQLCSSLLHNCRVTTQELRGNSPERSARKAQTRPCIRVKFRAMDLVALLSRPEGKTLEFKRDLSSPEGALKAIVAFANTSGGVIVLGVEDGTKKVKGIRDVLAEEERLASLIADNISPKLIPSMEVMPWRKTHVLAVEIYPSPNRPHYLNRLGPVEGVFVRVGSTNRRADSFLIEEMRRYNQVSSFDEQPMPDLNSEAVDFRVASEFFKPIRKLTLHGLQSLKVTASYQGRVVPTIGGVLLFSPIRLNHFPDAWVQVGRFGGSDRRRILDSTEVRS